MPWGMRENNNKAMRAFRSPLCHLAKSGDTVSMLKSLMGGNRSRLFSVLFAILPIAPIAASLSVTPAPDASSDQGTGPAPQAAPARAPGFQECGDCPRMVVVPPGTMTIGKSGNQGEPDERPSRVVAFSAPFAVSETEVTVEQFAAFVNDTGYEMGLGCWTYENDVFAERVDRSWINPGYARTGASPVTCVSWIDAMTYAKWLSAKTKATYRLLSESEWEYAARGGRTTPFSWGSEPSSCRRGAVDGASNRLCGGQGPLPVGTFQRNRFGLFDVHGNVWEWVLDCWNGSYATLAANGAPNGNGDCQRAVLRGGSWLTYPAAQRLGLRNWLSRTERQSHVGFRILRPFSAQELNANRIGL